MHTIASQFLVVLHVLGQDLLMAAVTWSGDPEAGWQLSARVGEASRSIRGADWEAPLDVVPKRARELGGLLSLVRYK